MAVTSLNGPGRTGLILTIVQTLGVWGLVTSAKTSSYARDVSDI